MTSATFHLGLIGYPLEHSLSPGLHTAALQSCGLEGNYSLYSIHSDDRQGLRELLARVRLGEIQGLNVTIPHKQNVIPFLDELTSIARSVGAVNTIYLRKNKLIGDNTDAPGFLTDLKIFLAESISLTLGGGSGVREKNALILGAGGSARAIVYALLNNGWNVTIAARRIEQAQQLADSFANYQLQITDFTLSNIAFSNISLLVNTTPVGMTPNVDESPWPMDLTFPPYAAIYDLVYNPRETRLVRDACSQGLRATTGLGMLIEQAALAFEIWTGHRPPRKALLEAISH